MLTSKPQLNLKNAKGYFREHLGVGDYYMQGHVVVGEWRGVAAQMLGLNGKVTEDQFLKMCDGLHPETGQKLTMRKNTTRREAGRNVSNRRVFYDFTISPPKSVSVVALMQDARIVAAHDRAARKMVDEMEKFAETRVRRGGANGERVTGAVAGALFRHDTSRELDPHLHTHCVLFNATFDGVEGQWKALHASGMYRAQKFAENVYYHELARELVSLGYQIKNHAKGFEIEGVPVSVIETFSKRHWQIEEETRHRIRVEGLKGNEKALREQVAQDSRRRKIRNAVVEKLRPGWEMEMNETERWVVQALSGKLEPKPQDRAIVPGREVPALVEWADKHVFERKSVVADYELWSEALARGRGENFEVETVKQTVAERGYIRDRETGKLTTLEVLRRELFLVEAVNAGRRKHRALNADYKPAASLSEEQSRAVKQILGSRDLVTLFQGGAGTGKSHTLAQVVRGLEAANHPVVVLAPQNQQAADLRKDGLGEAQTVARALAAKVPLPRSAVVIVDEAGQIGAADMGKLVRQVREVEGRLILSGDTRQHGAVAASDALRAIEQYSDVKPVRLETIRRQDPERMRTVEQKKFVTKYREAVQAAAAGDLGKSFRLLDEMGCIQELDTEECYQKLAKAYCEAVSGDRPQKVLAVAQTWAEVREANAAIRQKLQEVKKLGRGVTVTAWQPSGLTEAQKRDARFLCKFQSGPDAGMGAYFVRDYGRFKKGDLCEIAGLGEQGVLLRKEGLVTEVSHEYAERFVVAESHSVEVATGERLLMKFNGKSVEGRAIRNGELVTVKKVLSDGRIRVTGEDGKRKTLSAGQRMFVPGYAVTSYASQGKTVDTVLLAHANGETPVNRQQWYVGISRARGKIAVFTGDKEALRMHLEQASGNRELALSINPDEQSIEAARQLNQRLEEAFQHDLCVNSWQQHQSLHESVDLRQEVAVATEIAHGIEPAASIEPAVELGIEPSAAPVVAPAIKPEQKPEAAEVSEKISQQVWWQIHQHIAQQNNYHQSRGRGIRL